jgi:hypothetical protein
MTTVSDTAATPGRRFRLPPDCTVESLHARTIARHRTGGGSRPEVVTVNLEDLDPLCPRAVLKDHGRCDRWFAFLLGPLLSAREARALCRLQGLPGIPALLGRMGSRALVMEHIPARTLRHAGNDADADWNAFFARLEALVAGMHGRGVAHCDLRSPSNVLVDDAWRPWLVDFVASVTQGGRFNPLGRWLFRRFRSADRAAVAKLKQRFAPSLMTAEDMRRLAGEGGLAWCARRIGASVRTLARAVFTRPG